MHNPLHDTPTPRPMPDRLPPKEKRHCHQHNGDANPCHRPKRIDIPALLDPGVCVKGEKEAEGGFETELSDCYLAGGWAVGVDCVDEGYVGGLDDCEGYWKYMLVGVFKEGEGKRRTQAEAEGGNHPVEFVAYADAVEDER
jgi:hypothetical protein